MIYSELDTPSLLVDIDILKTNIKKMQDLVRGTGINLRPHTKTHKCPDIGKMQIEEGAQGITVAKLGEAEAMIESGITDIFIAYPIYGSAKKDRLINIFKKAKIIISLDSFEVADFLSRLGEEINRKVSILFEINTGLNRCGVEPDLEAVKLAKKINELPGIDFKGLMGYSGSAYSLEGLEKTKKEATKQYSILMDFKNKLIETGINVEVVSTGSTPTVEFEKDMKGLTELRPGGYIFNDRTQIALGRVGEGRCAARVLSTVISNPVEERAVMDAGSKAFCSDGILGDTSYGYGLVKNRPDITVEKLNEEHGVLISSNKEINLNIGDRLEVIPNHVCVVINNFDVMYLTKNNEVVGEFKIAGRGKMQ